MLEKILFIINPKSGVDRIKALNEDIDFCLDKSKYIPVIKYTEYKQHGTIIAQQALNDGIRIMVAVGGDGSVNDIISGIHGSEAVLAIIPKGSGNGLARTLGIPLNVKQAIETINHENIINIDLGKMNEKIFVSNVGVGFDVQVARKFEKSKKRGLKNYGFIVFKYLWRYKCWNWTIEIDGLQIQEKAFMVNIANGKQFGYNFKIAPQADMRDGWLDVIIIKKFPKILGLFIALQAFRGTILRSPYVKYYKGKRIKVHHTKLNEVQMDGDVHLTNNTPKVEVIPKALKIIVPPID